MNISIQTYIFDDNDGRRKSHQRTFSRAKYSYMENFLIPDIQVNSPAIIFVHSSDLRDFSHIFHHKIKECLLNAEVIFVVYSGGGESYVHEVLRKINFDFTDRICVVGRAVDKQNPLTVVEIDHIYQEIDIQDSKLSFRNPDCLRQPIDHLCALSCLCQAYLTTHATAPKSTPLNAALQILGWNTWSTTPAGQEIATHLITQSSTTETPDWWQQVLQSHPTTPIFTTLQTEWGRSPLPESITTLIDRIDQSLVLDDPDLIAQAFLYLSHHLDHPKTPETITAPWYSPHLNTLIPIRQLLQRFRLTHVTPKNRAISAILTLLHDATSAPSHHQPYLTDTAPESDDELLILLIDQSTPTNTVIDQIKHLRFHQKWRGAILTIAHSVTVAKLNRWALFSLQTPTCDSDRKVSQLCLPRPVLLTEGLSALSWLIPYDAPALELTCQALSPSSDSPTQNIWQLWERIESDSNRSTRSIITEIIDIVLKHEETIFTHVIGHNDFSLIRKFNRDPDSVPEPEVLALIHRIMDTLQKWSLPVYSPQNDESPCR
jgi:hypothetical protein